MPRIPDVFSNTLDQIEYLIGQKFGSFWAANRTPYYGEIAEEKRSKIYPDSRLSKEMDAYRAELLSRGADEIKRLAHEAIALEREKSQKFAAELELTRSWNQPSANADYKYWSVSTYWTIDEGVALLLEKDPRQLKWEDLESHRSVSPFAKRFDEIRELAVRAETARIIGKWNIPSAFLRWAERSDLKISPELRKHVEERGIVIADWQDACEKAQTKAVELTNLVTQSAAIITRLTAERDELVTRLAERRAGPWPWGTHETPLLSHLAAAADKWWNNFDPSDPTTAPTNPEVKKWLLERGVADRVAEVFAQALRAPDIPPGPRK